MTSMQPYLLRAVSEWIIDNNFTPYLMVNALYENVKVPQQYVEDGKIILNISGTAVQGLILNNECVSFNARFSGKPLSVYIPNPAVLAIYAQENGKGMFFKPEDLEGSPPPKNEIPPEPLFKRVK